MVLWLLQGEYVWNIGWEKKLETERAAVLRKAQQQKEDEEKAAQRGGALRLSNLSVLEEDDLSAELERIRIKKQKQAEEAALLAAKREVAKEKARVGPRGTYKPAGKNWRYPATRRERQTWQKDWAKAQKFSNVLSTAEIVQRARLEAKEDEEKRERIRLEGEKQYEEMKSNLLIITAAASVSIFGLVYQSYEDHQIAYSFGFGAAGSLFYLNLLNKKVDSLADPEGAGAGAAAPTLLVPLILFMVFNRWNALAAPSTGLTLSLLPMLLGFFTFKVATLAQVYFDVERARSAETDYTPDVGISPATGLRTDDTWQTD